MGKHFLTVIHPDEHERMMDIYLRRHRGEPAPSNYEFTGLRKDGKPVPIEISSTVGTHQGRSSSFAFLRDITERKQGEETLIRTYAKMTRLINSISSILIAVSEEDRIVFWNTAAEREFRLSELEIIGKPLGALGIQWDWDRIKEGISQCRRENRNLGLDNVKFIQGTGKDGLLGLRLTPLMGEEFLGTGILIQGANITNRKIIESQLTQAQKLESIGQLAAGIAHEINTPTQYVGDNVRFLQTSFEGISKVLKKYHGLKEGVREGKNPEALIDELEELIESVDMDYLTEEIPRAIQQTLEGVTRVSRIVGSMKEFAHPGKVEKVFIDINKAVENTILVARNEWKYVAELTTALDPSLPQVSCIPGDINQVLLNVLVNAAQAVAEVVRDGSEGKGEISFSTRKVDDTRIEIRISDTGKGIPEGIQGKIFDPFFTTKEVGKGTGQGLAISYKAIVERHAGSITFQTEMGQGTTFIIGLPIEDSIDAGNKET
ncbi:MAG: histidine kinase [Desulfobacca sp.]|nr:histidine kinase [Desulfobacca sp.]